MMYNEEQNPSNEAVKRTNRLVYQSSKLIYKANNVQKKNKSDTIKRIQKKKIVYKSHKERMKSAVKRGGNKLKSKLSTLLKQKSLLVVLIALIILIAFIMSIFTTCSVMGTIMLSGIVAETTYLKDIESIEYEIHEEYFNDSDFLAIITEAEKYIGYPYIWGGSNPETSFDCSGFLCWVYNTSGVCSIERTTAQGLYDKCEIIPENEVRPGDLVFFTGTYETDKEVTHVGIYVGNNMMLHCGNPIGYTSINTDYWNEHFYGFGDLINKEQE